MKRGRDPHPCWCGARRSAWVRVLDDRGTSWGPFPVCCDHLKPTTWPGRVLSVALSIALADGAEWIGGDAWRYVALEGGAGGMLLERPGGVPRE